MPLENSSADFSLPIVRGPHQPQGISPRSPPEKTLTVPTNQNASTSELDRHWMRLALELAKQGRGWVEPNPMVGCIAVADGKIIGQGFHRKFGGPHAEVDALKDLGPADLQDATIYVTLEPCNHFGKTPPCAPFVAERRPKRVVVAMLDPFPAVAGRGIRLLEGSGIRVEIGILQKEAEQLNAPYIKLLHHKRPWVTAKWAMTLDGSIATKTGDSKWISNSLSRDHVHRTRARMDAMITSVGTVLADDPLLTARPTSYDGMIRTPIRVVLDRTLRIPLNCQLAKSAKGVPTVVVTLEGASSENIAALHSLGIDVLSVPKDDHRSTLEFALDYLGTKRCTNVMLECGPELMGHAMDLHCIDEIECFIAPLVIGGNSLRPVRGLGVEKLSEATRWHLVSTTSFGEDTLLTYRRASGSATY
jgi:diaminohydroxyphosphoribosylaminopyrimidine deaminase/5-amino-6-(5-phosphoribosylamino)uracil reductase